MNKLLPIFAMIVCLAPLGVPAAAMAASPDGVTVVKAALILKQEWGGKRHRGDRDNNNGQGNNGERSNWNNGDDRGRRDDNRRDDRAIQARNLAQSYRNVTNVIKVDPEGGPYFSAKVMTRDGHLLYLRINTDTGSVSED